MPDNEAIIAFSILLCAKKLVVAVRDSIVAPVQIQVSKIPEDAVKEDTSSESKNPVAPLKEFITIESIDKEANEPEDATIYPNEA